MNLGFLSGNTGLYDRLTSEEMVRYYADLHEMSNSDYISSRNKLFDLLLCMILQVGELAKQVLE